MVATSKDRNHYYDDDEDDEGSELESVKLFYYTHTLLHWRIGILKSSPLTWSLIVHTRARRS